MRRILQAWQWLFSCRYVVAYDPADVHWYVDWNDEPPPRYNPALAHEHGANLAGEFRTWRKAHRFLTYLQSRSYFDSDPIYPTRIIRIRRKA